MCAYFGIVNCKQHVLWYREKKQIPLRNVVFQFNQLWRMWKIDIDLGRLKIDLFSLDVEWGRGKADVCVSFWRRKISNTTGECKYISIHSVYIYFSPHFRRMLLYCSNRYPYYRPLNLNILQFSIHHQKSRRTERQLSSSKEHLLVKILLKKSQR